MADNKILVLRNAKEIVTVCDNQELFKSGVDQGKVLFVIPILDVSSCLILTFFNKISRSVFSQTLLSLYKMEES